MSVKVTKKCIILIIEGEDVETVSDICEMIRIVTDSQSNYGEFTSFRKRLSHTINWEKAKDFMHKVFEAMD